MRVTDAIPFLFPITSAPMPCLETARVVKRSGPRVREVLGLGKLTGKLI
jgi:hypothetical protein